MVTDPSTSARFVAFDALTNTCDPLDDHNHGTHVAGIVGAAGGKGVGAGGSAYSNTASVRTR